MIKKFLTITISAFILTACGGSSADDYPAGGGDTTGGGGTTTGGGDTAGGGDTTPAEPIGGQSGTAFAFGDNGDAATGIEAVSPVCTAAITTSFTGFALDGATWCVWPCPANAGVENDDGDEYGFISGTGETCRATNEPQGTVVVSPISAAINGCPDGGCIDGSDDFVEIFVTPNASGADLAGSYQCTTWDFNGNTDIWSELSNPAPFGLTLTADMNATVNGAATTWSYTNGQLTLAGNATLNNVAVGAGSFSSYNSPTSLVRCM